MPASEMCHYCHLQKFKFVQESPYSVYDNASFVPRYKYVANGKRSIALTSRVIHDAPSN